MKVAAVLALTLALVAPSAATAGGAGATPIEKVVEMLSNLETKIINEGKEAQKVYDEYSEFCEDKSKNLAFEIKTEKGEVAELEATIEKEAATIAALTEKIEELSGAIAIDETDLKAANMIRAKEAATFADEKKELMDIIDTIERAVGILRKEMAGGASMMQLKSAGSITQALSVMVQASALSSADAQKLTALVQSSEASENDDDQEPGAPAAAVYENQSGDIVEVLEGMQEKAEAQLADAEKKETANIHAFQLLAQGIKDEIKFATKEMEEAKKDLAAASEAKAAAEGELDATSKDLKSDIETLATLHHDCMTAAEEFEAETKSRGEELKALAEAKKVIKETTSGAADLSYGFDQVSLLQVSSGISLSSGADLSKFEAVRFVRDLARKEHSAALTQLASKMAHAMRSGSGEDPFQKVKGLIAEMIERLEEEANADATHKAFCDKEMAETNTKKDDKTAEIEKLTSQIDVMTARSSKLKEEVAALQKELAELTKMQAEMDALRQKEHADFLANKADLEQGVEGVKLALKILTEYYAKTDKAHQAAQGAGSGIIGLLEVVESDFTTGLAQTIATEETAQRDYEEQTKQNEIDKATKQQDVKYKGKEAAGLDKAIAEATSDRSTVQSELDAVMEYLESLEKQCVAKAETYEERVRRRTAEIEGLKQALDILSGEAVLLQKGTSHGALRGVRAHRHA